MNEGAYGHPTVRLCDKCGSDWLAWSKSTATTCLPCHFEAELAAARARIAELEAELAQRIRIMPPVVRPVFPVNPDDYPGDDPELDDEHGVEMVVKLLSSTLDGDTAGVCADEGLQRLRERITALAKPVAPIPCAERMPEPGERVLAVQFARFDGQHWYSEGYLIADPSHWLPSNPPEASGASAAASEPASPPP